MSLKLVSQLRKKTIATYKNVVNLKILNLPISHFLASIVLIPLRINHKKYFLHLVKNVLNAMEQFILLFLVQLMSFLKGNDYNELK